MVSCILSANYRIQKGYLAVPDCHAHHENPCLEGRIRGFCGSIKQNQHILSPRIRIRRRGICEFGLEKRAVKFAVVRLFFSESFPALAVQRSVAAHAKSFEMRNCGGEDGSM